MSTGKVRIGTSGWAYPHWRNRFYPRGMPAREWLEFYQQQFSTVEINTTFYRLPASKMVHGWHDEAPPRFRYAAKGSRFITHIRHLHDCAPSVRRFFDRMAPLKSYLGVVLWQLPPDFERDDDLLEGFLHALPASPRHAIEFRHASWDHDDVYAILRHHRIACVCASSETANRKVATTDFVYVRFHGLHGDYAHDYSDAGLRPWASWLEEMAADGRNGYVFFNNDGMARAPENAHRLAEMLGEAAYPWGG
jgi:uncharacterized protein YecE (DUF72 family)